MRKNLKLKDSLILLLVWNTLSIALFDILYLYTILYFLIFTNITFIYFLLKKGMSNISLKKLIIIFFILKILLISILSKEFFYRNEKSFNGNKDFIIKVTYDNIFKDLKNNRLIRFKIKDQIENKLLKGINYIYVVKESKKRFIDASSYLIRFKDYKYYKNGLLLQNKYNINKLRKNIFLNYFGWNKNKINEFLKQDFNRLCWSIVTGNSNVLKIEEKRKYKATGTAHLFAVSGLHLGFIFLLSKVLLMNSRNRRLNAIVSLFFCFFYCFAVGFPQSAVRAFIMVLILESSMIFQMKTKSIYALCWTLFLVIFSSSYSILSLSFQLSFTIVAFIIFFITKNNPYQSHYSIKSIILNYLIISTACYFGSFYLIWDNFGYFPKTSILVNFFISPIVFIFFCFSFINIFLFFIFDLSIFYYLTEYIYIIINSIIHFFDSLEKIIELQNKRLSIHDIFHLFLFVFIILLNFLYLKQNTKFLIIISFYICTILFSIL